jgi:hypothetical protein
MSKLDITMLTRAADETLAVTENPRHRQILENYRRHAILETTGRWQEIFTPEMTVEHPVYRVSASEFITVAEAQERLLPLLRPLPALLG